MNSTRLLIIGYVWPEPNSSAAGARMMQLIGFFQKLDYHITFVTSARTTPAMINLESLQIDVKEVQPNDDEFDKFVTNLDPQVVLFDRFMMEEQFGWRIDQNCPNALKILDTEDLHSLRKVREQVYKTGENFEDVYKTAEITKREIAAIYRCDISLIISEYEMNLLIEELKVPAHIVFYLPFMLNANEKTPITYAERANFMSIGNFLHEPNWRTVLYLKEHIWPTLRQRIPDAKLNIYGAYPSQKVWNLQNPAENFIVHGRAISAVEVMSAARVCLAPIPFGAGLKGKLAEAMLCGTPSVTTTVGSEAMAGTFSWSGIIANSPSEIIEAAVKLYEDESLWNAKSRQGFLILKQRFDRTMHQDRLEAFLKKVYPRLREHRLENFTGSMMKHHLQRSTYFLSRYIQIKNTYQ